MSIKTRLGISFAVVLVLAGCAASTATPAQESPTLESATPTPTLTHTPVVTPTEGPSPTPTATPLPLSETEPWLVFMMALPEQNQRPNLWAVNADGSGLQRLSDEGVFTYAVQPAHTREEGVLVAMVTNTRPNDGGRDLTLKLLHLPDRTIETITPLIVDQGDQSPIADYDPGLSIHLLWSEDGNRLAFIGQIDGPTMDVYVYDTRDKSITRLSSGDMQAYLVQWSPDGAWVIHGGYTYVGMGGPDFEALWAAHADGSGSITLAGEGEAVDSSTRSTGTLGWLDASHILIQQREYEAPSRVWSVNITTGTASLIFETDFSSAAYSPPTGVWLVSDYNIDDTDPHERLFRAGEFVDLPDYNLIGVRWYDEMQAFLGASSDGKLYTISALGDFAEMQGFQSVNPWQPPHIIHSPDEAYWAWYTNPSQASPGGLWIGPPKTVPTPHMNVSYGYEILSPKWSPDGQHLFMLGETGLWMLTPPDFSGVEIAHYKWSWRGGLQWVP